MKWLATLLLAVMLLPWSCSTEKIELSREEVLFSMVNRIPDFESFMAVDELITFQKELVKQDSNKVQLIERGNTPDGEIIYELQVGQGSHHALMYGFPEADDAVGAMTLLFVAQDLVNNAITSDFLDYTWHMVVCIDPEKARLNEGWFRGALTLTKFAKEFFRCPRAELPEWSFPTSAPAVKDRPVGAQALMDIIDEFPIEFVYSLHNSPFNGVSFTLSDDIPEVYAMLTKILSVETLPLGEGNAPVGTHFVAPGFYKVTLPSDRRVSGMVIVDGDDGLPQGSIAQHVKQKRGDALFAAIETPYFWDPRISDERSANASREEVFSEAIGVYNDTLNFIRTSFTALQDRMIENRSLFARALEDLLLQEKKEPFVEEGTATMGDFVKATIENKVPALLALGQYLRLLEAEQKAAMGMLPPEIKRALEESHSRFVTLSEQLEQQLDYSVISIKRAASMQLMAALHIMDYLQNRQDGME